MATSKTAPKKAAASEHLVALSNVKHDGKLYAEGDALYVNEAEAAQLVASGSAGSSKVAGAMAKAAKVIDGAWSAQQQADAEREKAEAAQRDADALRSSEVQASEKAHAEAAEKAQKAATSKASKA